MPRNLNVEDIGQRQVGQHPDAFGMRPGDELSDNIKLEALVFLGKADAADHVHDVFSRAFQPVDQVRAVVPRGHLVATAGVPGKQALVEIVRFGGVGLEGGQRRVGRDGMRDLRHLDRPAVGRREMRPTGCQLRIQGLTPGRIYFIDRIQLHDKLLLGFSGKQIECFYTRLPRRGTPQGGRAATLNRQMPESKNPGLGLILLRWS